MTSCQRPKECEPSRYRHGSDPPKQVPTASPTLVEHFLRLQRNPHSIHSLTSKAKKLIREPERCPAPLRGRSLPCHRLRSLSLFHGTRTNLYFFCMPSMQQFRRTVTVTLGVQRCLLTGSGLIKVERASLAQPESIQRNTCC